MMVSASQQKRIRIFIVATVPDTHWFFLRGQLGFLQSQGFDVTLVSSPGKRLKECKQRDGVRCVPILISRRMHPVRDVVSLCKLWRLFQREQPDIIQYSTPKAAFLGSIAATLAGIRCRIFLARGSIASAKRGWSVFLNRWAEWLTARLSEEVICVSPSLREFLRQQRILRPNEGVVIENGMSNGININHFASNPGNIDDSLQSKRGRSIGFIGRLNREKGLEELSIAWQAIRKACPDVKLLLVGRWDGEAQVLPHVRALLETDRRVEITGEIEDIRSALQQIAVLCFPSHREGFPNAPMEAAAAGIPVVAFNTVGSKDAVVSGRTGQLVEVGDVDALATAVERYLKNPELAKAHGRAGQLRVRSCFQQLPIWRGIMRSYEDALRRTNSSRGWYRAFGKPIFDRVASAVALILLSPLFLAVSVLIRWRLGSPVLFTQYRPGYAAKPFRIFKFRTMTDARDDRGKLLPDANRLTKFGRWLRSTSLDELPELLNILRGEMSFVGPRPLLMEYLARYSGDQKLRHDIKPGLTGLSQVKGRNMLSWRKKFQLDNFYIRKSSLLFDLRILWWTFRKVVKREGVVDRNGVTSTEFHPGNEVFLIGAGGHAKVVASALESSGRRVAGIYDDNELLWGSFVGGVQVIGGLEELKKNFSPGQACFSAIGDNRTRQRIANDLSRLGIRWETVIHPTAIVERGVVLQPGALVCAGAVVQPDVTIGAHAIVNTAARVDHDCRIGDFAHVAPNATLAGDCEVGALALVGASATVREGQTIGEEATVGAGSVVVRNVDNATTVAGCPARPIPEQRGNETSASFSWPQFDDPQVAAAAKVMRSGKVNYWTGSEGRSFESEFADYIGVKKAIAVANGTVALELALAALGIGPGDEVIVPSRTFIASASAVVMRGAQPVVADIDSFSQNLTVETIREVVTEKTRAIIAVHLGGWPCEMNAIVHFAKQHNIYVIEDCAQAHGARITGRHVGSFGDISAFSFCQDKILTTIGEGGMVVTDDIELWERAWSFKDHGKDWSLTQEPGEPGKYRFLHTSFGTNWRMTEVQAAVGRIQLSRLDQWHSERVKNATYLRQLLGDCPNLFFPVCAEGYEHAYYRLYGFVRLKGLRVGWTRDRIIAEIQSLGGEVGCGSCGVIYQEKAFERIRAPEHLPTAENAHATSLAFSVHPGLSRQRLEWLADQTKKVLSRATVMSSSHQAEAA